MDVILWPDTFHDHFHPQVAQAGVEVLEGAGCRVLLPPPGLCCGRPLYDFGMLRLARRQLERILDALRPQLRAGIPVIGLEPSCVAVFRDELPGLMPGDDDALMLSQRTFLLSEFLETQRPDWTPPVVSGKALVHVHCHHKSVLKDRAERALLARCGLEVGIPESGCCGMAGAFGFERRHYALSMQIAERALLPAVRAADEDTLIVANGFSCREQIAQGTGRQPLHLAEVLQRALRSRERTHVDYDSHPDMLPLVERNSREDGPNDAR